MVTALQTESTQRMRHQASPALYLTSSLSWIFEDGTDRLSRNVGKALNYTLRNSPEECSFNSYLFWRENDILPTYWMGKRLFLVPRQVLHILRTAF
jgi:hypothetical protein